MAGHAVKRRESTARDIVDDAKSSVTNELLLKYARNSPEVIEQKTGIPAKEAMSRLAEILRSRDWLSEKMEERLLMIELADLITSVRERMDNAAEENYADLAGAALRGYETIGKRLDARRKLTEEDIARISAAQGDMMMQAITTALDLTAEFVRKLHPDIDLEDDLREGFKNALPEAYAIVRDNIVE